MSGKSTSDDALPIPVFERIFRSYNATGFLPILLTVLLVAFALFIPNFVAVQNLLNVLRRTRLISSSSPPVRCWSSSSAASTCRRVRWSRSPSFPARWSWSPSKTRSPATPVSSSWSAFSPAWDAAPSSGS